MAKRPTYHPEMGAVFRQWREERFRGLTLRAVADIAKKRRTFPKLNFAYMQQLEAGARKLPQVDRLAQWADFVEKPRATVLELWMRVLLGDAVSDIVADFQRRTAGQIEAAGAPPAHVALAMAWLQAYATTEYRAVLEMIAGAPIQEPPATEETLSEVDRRQDAFDAAEEYRSLSVPSKAAVRSLMREMALWERQTVEGRVN